MEARPFIEEESRRLRAAYKRLKRTRHITQFQIAEACGWGSVSYVSRLMRGRAALTRESLALIAPVLDVLPELISPRLVAEHIKVPLRYLPLRIVRAADRGQWAQPLDTEKTVAVHIEHQSAYALTFTDECSPAEFQGWILVLEPVGEISPGDRLIYRKRRGLYGFGLILALAEGSRVELEVGVSNQREVVGMGGAFVVTSMLRKSAALN